MSKLSLDFLQTFVMLGRAKSVGKTCDELALTRQTVSRHIKLLEKAHNATLFERRGHARILTNAGEALFQSAAPLVDAANRLVGVDAAERSEIPANPDISVIEDDYRYLSVEHPLQTLWDGNHDFLRDVFAACVDAGFQIGAAAFATIEPHAVIARKTNDIWVVSHVGTKSAFYRNSGREKALAAVGNPAGYGFKWDRYNMIYTRNFDVLSQYGGARLEHVYTAVPIGDRQDVPLSYQRLKMGCKYPDGTSVIVSVANHTTNVNIQALDDSDLPRMSAKMERPPTLEPVDATD